MLSASLNKTFLSLSKINSILNSIPKESVLASNYNCHLPPALGQHFAFIWTSMLCGQSRMLPNFVLFLHVFVKKQCIVLNCIMKLLNNSFVYKHETKYRVCITDLEMHFVSQWQISLLKACTFCDYMRTRAGWYWVYTVWYRYRVHINLLYKANYKIPNISVLNFFFFFFFFYIK